MPVLESTAHVSTIDPRHVREMVKQIARPPEVRLIHAATDTDRGRTVFTILGEPEALCDALVGLASRCVDLIDLREQERAQPPLGALDLIALSPPNSDVTLEQTADIARALAERIAAHADITTVLYAAADPEERTIEDLRQGGLGRLGRRIEKGEVPCFSATETREQRSRRGVTCVGARATLVSLRVSLASQELRIARRFAERLRESSGGLRGVHAMGLRVDQSHVDVVMDLVDHETTSIERAFTELARLATEAGVEILRSQVVGCVPRAAWPEGLAETIGEPNMVEEELTARTLETWLPGGIAAELPGLDVEAFPVPGADDSKVPEVQGDRPPVVRVLDLSLNEAGGVLADLVEQLGERPYRAGQILQAVWGNHARSISELSSLPAKLRTALVPRLEIGLLALSEKAKSQDGTVKYLWRLPDGAEIESVCIPTERRTTFCVSSQVGCSLKCTFCATGHLGFARNLSTGEILDQVLAMIADQDIAAESLNVVFMGMGEPGHNMKAVLGACRTLNDPAGLNIGARRITVSTSGVIPAIEELAREPIQLRLAVSLHTADQELRERLMNIAKKHRLEELLESCTAYHDATRRRITFEYCVIPGVNDSDEQAEKLGRFAKRVPSKVNLIGLNPIAELDAPAADPKRLRDFRDQVAEASGGEVMIRETRGRDIEAACGMLHRQRTTGPA